MKKAQSNNGGGGVLLLHDVNSEEEDEEEEAKKTDNDDADNNQEDKGERTTTSVSLGQYNKHDGSENENNSENDTGNDTDTQNENENENDLCSRHVLTLSETRERNVIRNQAMLDRLGFDSSLKMRPPTIRSTKSNEVVGTATTTTTTTTTISDPGKSRRGMLLPPFNTDVVQGDRVGNHPQSEDTHWFDADNCSSSLNQLYDKYPHRQRQLQCLIGLMLPRLLQLNTTSLSSPSPSTSTSSLLSSTKSPTPIFVTGPAGQGKTAILRDILECFATHTASPTCYLNCDDNIDSTTTRIKSTGQYSFDGVCNAIYQQFWKHHHRNKLSRPKEKKKNKKNRYLASHDRPIATLSPPNSDLQATSTSTCDMEEDSAVVDDSINSTCQVLEAEVEMDAEWEMDVEVEERSKQQPSDRSHLSRTASTVKNYFPNAPKRQNSKILQLVGSQSSATASTTAANAISSSYQDSTAAAKLARDLVGLFGHDQAAILVLDRAERLFSYPTSGAMDRSNFLAQLLLVPRTAGIQLTIIAISTSSLLEKTRVHPLQATIDLTINPIIIRFRAYKNKRMLHDVLRQNHTQKLVTGREIFSDTRSAFQISALDAFLNTVVQSLQDTTTDVNEYVRIGHCLWPLYIEPLSSPEAIRRTLQAIHNNSSLSLQTDVSSAPQPQERRSIMQREILSYLDHKLRPALIKHTTGSGCELSSAFSLTQFDTTRGRGGSHIDIGTMPPLAKYFLLSAYLCSENLAERDKQFFSIENSGKRRRMRTASSADGSPDKDYQNDPKEEDYAALVVSSTHPNTFPLERLLSVYSIVVELSMFTSSASLDASMISSSLDATVYSLLSQLVGLQLLHEYPSVSPYAMRRLNDTHYWTSLSRDEANVMAASLKFPLDRYIM